MSLDRDSDSQLEPRVIGSLQSTFVRAGGYVLSSISAVARGCRDLSFGYQAYFVSESWSGGRYRARTCDLLRVKHTLRLSAVAANLAKSAKSVQLSALTR